MGVILSFGDKSSQLLWVTNSWPFLSYRLLYMVRMLFTPYYFLFLKLKKILFLKLKKIRQFFISSQYYCHRELQNSLQNNATVKRMKSCKHDIPYVNERIKKELPKWMFLTAKLPEFLLSTDAGDDQRSCRWLAQLLAATWLSLWNLVEQFLSFSQERNYLLCCKNGIRNWDVC